MNSNSATRAGVSNWNLSSIMRDLAVAWRLLLDPSVPSLLKILLPGLALIYWISPIDLLPGLPFDDIAVVFILARFFAALVPKDALNRAYSGERARANTPQPEEEQGNVVDTTWRIIDDKEHR